LNPPAAEIVKKKADLEIGGVAFPSPHNQCWPEPTPFILSIQFGMQIIQQKDLVLLLYPSDHQVRRVRMNVPHSERPTISWQGESVGRYEGGTLWSTRSARRSGRFRWSTDLEHPSARHCM
jgi:hypothetical protein